MIFIIMILYHVDQQIDIEMDGLVHSHFQEFFLKELCHVQYVMFILMNFSNHVDQQIENLDIEMAWCTLIRISGNKL